MLNLIQAKLVCKKLLNKWNCNGKNRENNIKIKFKDLLAKLDSFNHEKDNINMKYRF